VSAFFPDEAGTFLSAPMAKLGWGEPTMVTLSVGVITRDPAWTKSHTRVIALVLPSPGPCDPVLPGPTSPAREFSSGRIFFACGGLAILFHHIEGERGLLFAWGANANCGSASADSTRGSASRRCRSPRRSGFAVSILKESYARIRATATSR